MAHRTHAPKPLMGLAGGLTKSKAARVNHGHCHVSKTGDRMDSIQVISILASSRGTSMSTPGAQISFIPTETALPCLVLARPAYLAH